ncbi:translation initiation factor eIF3 subunit g [Coemansia aciculifera]|nr:translation initiation factor eIF3 subunit g [Coemansia aciculifera]
MSSAELSKTNWADDVEDQEFPSVEVITNADGTKTVIENRLNEDGKRVRVTRKIQEKIVQEHVNRAVAERKKWAKFGELRSDGTMKANGGVATTIGEVVELRLSQYAAQMKQQEIDAAEQEKAAAVKSSKILCRVCRGEHFTAKCPYKDTMTSAEDILGGGPVTAAAASADDGKGGPNAYVPPHMRAGAKSFGAGGGRAGSLGAGDARGDRRDEHPTIRITNLSEDTLEADVNQLCRPFGPLARVFVATDRSTGYCKGFAFVSYYDHDSAEKAIGKLNGHGFDNLILSADWANGGK